MQPLRRIPCRLAAFALACVSLDSLVPNEARADLLAGSYAYSTVFRYDDDGTPIANGVGFGSAGLNFASGNTVGPDGNIYVSSLGTGEILFYDGQTGVPLPSPHVGGRDGLFATLTNEGNEEVPVGGPGPLRFGPDGKLYVADFSGDSIRVFNGTTGVEGMPAGTCPAERRAASPSLRMATSTPATSTRPASIASITATRASTCAAAIRRPRYRQLALVSQRRSSPGGRFVRQQDHRIRPERSESNDIRYDCAARQSAQARQSLWQQFPIRPRLRSGRQHRARRAGIYQSAG